MKRHEMRTGRRTQDPGRRSARGTLRVPPVPLRPASLNPGDIMPSLILGSDTLSVRLNSRRLEVVRHDHKNPQAETVRTDVPLHDLDRVVVIGQPSLTTPVLAELMDTGIPCYFLTR